MLDTNVLVSARERHLLRVLASAGALIPQWSDITSDELTTALRRRYTETGDDQSLAHRKAVETVAEYNAFFPSAEVTTRSRSLALEGMTHPKDRHVLAAALLSDADGIVTRDQNDFDRPAFPPGIRRLRDRDLLLELASRRPSAFRAALEALQQDLDGFPRPTTVVDYLDRVIDRLDRTTLEAIVESTGTTSRHRLGAASGETAHAPDRTGVTGRSRTSLPRSAHDRPRRRGLER